MRYLRFVFVALAIGAWAAGPLPSALAQTAPTYQSSDPSKDEMMDHPPAQVTVTFDQPLDQSSWMNVLDECGNEVDAGPATVDLNELTVQIGDRKPAGMYEVVYKAVGLAGATGSSGSSFHFMVHEGQACSGGGSMHHHHGGGKKNHHGGHDGHGNHDGGGHDGHGGMDMGSHHSGHTGMPGMADHSGHTGMPGMADHSGHTGMPGMPGMTDHSGHMEGHHHGGHGEHGSPRTPAGGGQPPPLATGGGNVPVGADGQAVLVGLGLALAVGVLGGWLLRLSSTLAGI